MRYPEVMTEDLTMYYAAHGKSLARFGDGELNICLGRASVSQKYDPALQVELRVLLSRPQTDNGNPRLLVCIPNLAGPKQTPRAAFWKKYADPALVSQLYGRQQFGSSFVSRPDNAPWIDRVNYWQMVESVWRGRDVVLIAGDLHMMDIIKPTCATLAVIAGPKRDAYAAIDVLYKAALDELRERDIPVVICLGAAGTALAARLSRKGVWALDLGFISNFMHPKNIGAFSMQPEDLATEEYRVLLRHAHATTGWGRGGASWADQIANYARKLETTDILDYGCGQRTLAPVLAAQGFSCKEYDPGVIGCDTPPKIADLVSSTDVLEHIEPELVDNVCSHIYRLARKGAFLVIAKKPAKKILADGRNAHLSCHETEWWIDRLVAAGFEREKMKIVQDEWKKVVIKLSK